MKSESNILRDGWRDWRRIADNLPKLVEDTKSDLNEIGEFVNCHNVIMMIKLTINERLQNYVNLCHACEIAERRIETRLDNICHYCPLDKDACNSVNSYYKTFINNLLYNTDYAQKCAQSIADAYKDAYFRS